MRLGIKGKQVLYVTSLVGVFVVVLSLLYLARLAQANLNESHARAQCWRMLIFQRARDVVVEDADPYEPLRRGSRTPDDSGLEPDREESSRSPRSSTRTARSSRKDPALQEVALRPGQDLKALLSQSAFAQLRAIYAGQGRNLEVRQPLLIGASQIGSIRIGVSTLLIRDELERVAAARVGRRARSRWALRCLSRRCSAQLILRPIHVLRSGLTRLGRGESGVRLDLVRTTNSESSGRSSTRSARSCPPIVRRWPARWHISSRPSITSRMPSRWSVRAGTCSSSNPAARALFPAAAIGVSLNDLMAADHPLRRLFEQTLASRQSHGPDLGEPRVGRAPASSVTP